MQDVARKAGVSVATVSYVINQQPGVSPETRDRVFAAVSELGYKPHHSARALATNRTGYLGLLIWDPNADGEVASPGHLRDAPAPAEMIRGIHSLLAARGLHLLYGSTVGRARPRRYDPPMLSEGRVDGLFLVGGQFEPAFIAQLAERYRVPMILVGLAPVECPITAVSPDHMHAVRLGVRHLAEQGHVRIGFVGGPPISMNSATKVAGYRLAMADAGLSVDPDLSADGDFTVDAGEQAAARLLRLPAPRRPTALYIGADPRAAIGALRAARAAGLRVPDDLSLVCHGDGVLVESSDPAITAADLPHHEVGMVAAQRMLALLEGESGSLQRVLLPIRLVERASVASLLRSSKN